MQATMRIAPPHTEQVSMSMPNTRFRRCAQVIAARRAVGETAVIEDPAAFVARW